MMRFDFARAANVLAVVVMAAAVLAFSSGAIDMRNHADAAQARNHHIDTRFAYLCGVVDAHGVTLSSSAAAICAAMHDPRDTDPHAVPLPPPPEPR